MYEVLDKVFGYAYLLLHFLKDTDFLGLLREIFPKDAPWERFLAHCLHQILKDGSRISCEDFTAKSFVSHFLPDVPFPTLRCDSAFNASQGADSVRMAFFKAFVGLMRKRHPQFGNCCYVDSTPLPCDLSDNPFCALCSHGLSGAQTMMRLALVIDEETGYPVWYDILPGNVPDVGTLPVVYSDIEASLGIRITSAVLDAGYLNRDIVSSHNRGTDRLLIARMPMRKGYPAKSLYWKLRSLFQRGKYAFARKGHLYFGKREEISLFGHDEYAYVYVDHDNALKHGRDLMSRHPDDFEEMKAKDKDWEMVKGGYFVLLSNRRETPARMLDLYFGRTEIETVFKTSKEYLGLLPLAKWTDTTVRGKILADVIDTIILLAMRKCRAKNAPTLSISDILGQSQSLMCIINGDRITVAPQATGQEMLRRTGREGNPGTSQQKRFRRDFFDAYPTGIKCSVTFDEILG